MSTSRTCCGPPPEWSTGATCSWSAASRCSGPGTKRRSQRQRSCPWRPISRCSTIPDGELADRISGAIGELSSFDHSFGYHADGVALETAILPAGCQERLIVFDPPDAEPGRGLCLEPHDCVVSKLVAGRPKDRAFAEALIDAGLVDPRILLDRIELLDDRVHAGDRDRLRAWVRARPGR